MSGLICLLDSFCSDYSTVEPLSIDRLLTWVNAFNDSSLVMWCRQYSAVIVVLLWFITVLLVLLVFTISCPVLYICVFYRTIFSCRLVEHNCSLSTIQLSQKSHWYLYNIKYLYEMRDFSYGFWPNFALSSGLLHWHNYSLLRESTQHTDVRGVISKPSITY